MPARFKTYSWYALSSGSWKRPQRADVVHEQISKICQAFLYCSASTILSHRVASFANVTGELEAFPVRFLALSAE
jgi:hypothetical protein